MKKKGLIVLLSLIILPGIKAQQNQEAIVMTKLSENLYKVCASDFVNLVVFLGVEGALLVDTGFDETAEDIMAKLKELGMSEIKYIINTHSDYDHIAGNRRLKKDACVLSHMNCRSQLMEYAAPDFDIPFDKALFRAALPTISFEDPVSLFFNGEEIRIFPMIGGHTDEDVIVHFKKAGVVCLGDMIMPGSFPVVKRNNGGDPITLSKKVGELIAMFPSETSFVVGHGEQNMTKEELISYHEMLTSTIAVVETALKNDLSVDEMKRKKILKDWSRYSDSTIEETTAETWIETVYASLLRKDCPVPEV